MEIEAMQKRVLELKENQKSFDEQIVFSQGQIQSLINTNPQIQAMNQTINRLVAERNVAQGKISMMEELIKLEIGDPDLPEDPPKKKKK